MAREAVAAGHPRGLSTAAISELGDSMPNRHTIRALINTLSAEPEFLTTAAVDPEAHLLER